MKTEDELFNFRKYIWTYNYIFLHLLKLINNEIPSCSCRSLLREWEMWTFCRAMQEDHNFSSSSFTRKISIASISNPDNTTLIQTELVPDAATYQF